VTRFWESKQEESYRNTLDGHTQKEKMYLSSLHLTRLQDEDADEKDETADEDACIENDENEVFDLENNDDNNDSTNNQAFVPNEDIQYVERGEPDAIYRTRRWILSSGTDVGQILSEYRQKIPESQKCMG